MHEARAAGRPLTLVHALRTVSGDHEGTEVHRRRAQRVCEAAVASAAQGYERVRIVVCEGDPEAALLGEAQRASLLVLGACGPARSRQDAVGLTTQHCLRHAACPVMVVPAGCQTVCVTRRVILAVAPRSPGAEAADWARQEAIRLGCEQVVVTARLSPTRPGSTEPGAVQALEHGVVRSLLELLGPDDLVVMADHGRAGAHPSTHSVGAGLLAGAPCPVVLVPSARASTEG